MEGKTQSIKEKRTYQKPEIKGVRLESEMLHMDCGHSPGSQLLLF